MSDILRSSRDVGSFLHPVARIRSGGPASPQHGDGRGQHLFAPHPYGDFDGRALLALDARRAPDPTAARLSAERHACLPTCSAISDRQPTTLVESVSIVQRPSRSGTISGSEKSARVKPKGVSILSIAATTNGRSTRVAYNGMASTPIRALAVERALEGKTLDAESIAPALAVAAEGTSPTDDAIASAWYRREVLPVHLKRLLLGETA